MLNEKTFKQRKKIFKQRKQLIWSLKFHADTAAVFTAK